MGATQKTPMRKKMYVEDMPLPFLPLSENDDLSTTLFNDSVPATEMNSDETLHKFQ